jgi:hypothetical protein
VTHPCQPQTVHKTNESPNTRRQDQEYPTTTVPGGRHYRHYGAYTKATKENSDQQLSAAGVLHGHPLSDQ